MNDSYLKTWLGFQTIPGLGLKIRLKLLELMPDIYHWKNLSNEEAYQFGISKQVCELLKKPINSNLIKKEMAWLADHHAEIIPLTDLRYPAILRQIADPPWTLFLLGNTKLLNQTQLAIVGSRAATKQGVIDAAQFAKEIGEAGITITSGLARGIDGAAHAGAMQTKGNTIAVLAHGLMHHYPKQHKALLAEMIQSGGAVISEWLPSIAPRAEFFPGRNRIIAGISRGVLVVEAKLRSGSLITARLAAEYGRDVFALPHSIQLVQGRGCHQLIRDGALLVETPNEILENWQLPISKSEDFSHVKMNVASRCQQIQPHFDQYEISSHTQLNTQETQILACFLKRTTLSFEVLQNKSGLTTDELSSMLLALEMKGLINSVAGGYVLNEDNLD